ncbi:MAG: YbjN domain-containing protein [Erythrobacter sp.]|uniref:hypothetical protein n=1 Tax=Erythrobacter sp. TaxID=1042 RepID=UPI0025D4D06E|nr:hypothetical protein [Erythrobacter sp.]MCL9997871.1 YbjN domain-containing protein [Erythrobacter sp.]
MTRLRAFAAALAVAGAAAPAAAQDYDAKRIVMSVTQADLAATVTALGHKVRETGKPGETYLAAESEDGIVYLLFGTACDVSGVPGCQGVMIQARFDLPEGTSFETLAKANDAQAAISVTADFEEKSLVFTRYHVLDQGVTMANIRENINVLLSIIGDAYPVAAGEDAGG